MKQKTFSIIGVGMMGASLGLAIKKYKAPYHVIGVGRDSKRLKKIKQLKICDEVFIDYQKGVANADIVMICSPVSHIVSIVEKILPFLKPQTILTDIGSVKSQIVQSVQSLLDSSKYSHLNLSFVGSHPMAGSEKTGFEFARADLYQQSTLVFCPTEKKQALDILKKLWISVGAKTLTLAPEIHDILVAQTSHLPHILSGVLAQSIDHSNQLDKNTARLIAGSFRDMTRISDADPEQWAAIASMNQKFLMGALKAYRDRLTRIVQNIGSNLNSVDEWKIFFKSSQLARQRVLQSKK